MVDVLASPGMIPQSLIGNELAEKVGKESRPFSILSINKTVLKAIRGLSRLRADILHSISHGFFHKKEIAKEFRSLGVRTKLIKVDTLEVSRLFLRILEEYAKHIFDNKLICFMAFEVLAKKFAYSEAKAGTIVRVPCINQSQSLVWEEYYVDQKLMMDGGVPVFGLLPRRISEHAHPILLFKGSSPPNINSLMYKKDAIPTWKADIDRNGVGVSLFESSKDKIVNWLQKAKKSSKKKVLSVGHSLGGAIAQVSSIKFPSLVKEVFVFNAPMVRRELKEIYEKLEDSIKPKIKGFLCHQDIVSKLGGDCLIGKHYEISGFCKHLDHHSDVIMLTTKKFSFQELDVDRINHSTHISLLDALSRQVTIIAHKILLPVLEGMEEVADYCFNLK
ncbi:MAG: DUF2974 domain-containing protein [Chlamydiales bacterium]|nr:hypothetical protein [Chlamydiales bacterium]NCF70915.1 DUF2974 domain-containing protein [Chlamydiales bacterium]